MQRCQIQLSKKHIDPFMTVESSQFSYQDSKVFSLKGSCLSFVTIPENQDRHLQKSEKKHIEIPQNIVPIIQKSKQDRNTSENALLIKFLLKFKIFKQMAQKLSIDVVKNMIKEGKLHLYNSGDHLFTEGKKMKRIKIILSGEVGVINQQKNNQSEQGLWQTLHQLVEKLGRQTKQFRLKHNTSNKNSHQLFTKSFVMRKQTIVQKQDFQCLRRIQPNNFLDYNSLLDYDPKHSQTVGVTQDYTLIFTLGIQEFYECLLLFYTTKLNQVIKIFRKVSVFNFFQNSKLKMLIEKLKIVEFKKSETVYREGAIADRFYLLTEGQIQISKTISIFCQNPNNFYKSRVKISKDHLNNDIKILPYANFNGVYNFEAEQKLVALTSINPICIFGQQELIENTTRQVNAKVTSLSAKMYEIYLDDIQQFCNKISGTNSQKKMTIFNFFSLLEESITLKKILYRQNKLSQIVERQNKSKYKTLFQDQPKRTFSYKNNKIKRFLHSEISPRKQLQKDQQVPPTFNNFNYTDFLNEKQQQIEMIPSKAFTDAQAKVVKLTHTKYQDSSSIEHNKKNNDKSIRIRNRSTDQYSKRKITIDNLATNDSLSESPLSLTANLKQKQRGYFKTQQITLEQPLFNFNYFKTQQHQQKRLVFVAKKKMLESIYRRSPEKH